MVQSDLKNGLVWLNWAGLGLRRGWGVGGRLLPQANLHVHITKGTHHSSRWKCYCTVHNKTLPRDPVHFCGNPTPRYLTPPVVPRRGKKRLCTSLLTEKPKAPDGPLGPARLLSLLCEFLLLASAGSVRGVGCKGRCLYCGSGWRGSDRYRAEVGCAPATCEAFAQACAPMWRARRAFRPSAVPGASVHVGA